MKIIAYTVILVLISSLAKANKIDELKTNDDVQQFLIHKISKDWKEIELFEDSTHDTSRYGKNHFLKIDLNNDGRTDLVINGKYLFAITDDGGGKYSAHFIDRGAFMLDTYTLTDIIYSDKTPLLIISGSNNNNIVHYTEVKKSDTLILKYGSFMEYTRYPDNLKIEEIDFSASGCFGFCPVFELAIGADRKAIYKAVEYNDKEGTFKSTIDTAIYNSLINTINYAKINSLKDNYEVNWTDDKTVNLEIKYTNGSTKKISDYGAVGTFGLQNIYGHLFSLRKSQKWR